MRGAEHKKALAAQIGEQAPGTALSRAMGALLGCAVADSLGHMFEFLPVVDGTSKESYFDRAAFKGGSAEPEESGFVGVHNVFRLKLGQWTDDCSMALCMADSLIEKRGFDGSDMRARFWNWWCRGYGNAFANDQRRGHRVSVGLGGNISHSIGSMVAGKRPTPKYEAGGEDSGNGSLMRLAPIAIFYARHGDELLMERARDSSYTTHPGPIAAEACALHAWPAGVVGGIHNLKHTVFVFSRLNVL